MRPEASGGISVELMLGDDCGESVKLSRASGHHQVGSSREDPERGV